MELKWLEDLQHLLDAGSISRAAERRHVTQPAYSRRIRQLEQWLGVELVDRSTKPIKIRDSAYALADDVRDLVNRFYALRNRVHDSGERITFVAQHTLAISRFPDIIRMLKRRLPAPGYRVVPANYEDCETLFYNDGDLLLCYQSAQRSFDFSQIPVRQLRLAGDSLIPVASSGLMRELGEIGAGMTLPLLMYQQGGFLAEALAASCLPDVIRDYRVEVICESAFSAGLRQMALADMGVAWLSRESIGADLASGRLISLADRLGETPLDVVLHYRDQGLAAEAGRIVAELEADA